MSQTYVTAQGDMLDAVAQRFYGATRGPTEAILAANLALCRDDPVLPENVTIVLPDLAAVKAPAKQTVNLWD